jgi:hypothetical protein
MATKTKGTGAPPSGVKSDAYTGLLVISFLALLVGCTFLYLDYDQYPSNKPPAVPGRSAPPATGPVPGAGQQGGPPPAGQQGGPPPAGMMGQQGVPPAGAMGMMGGPPAMP